MAKVKTADIFRSTLFLLATGCGVTAGGAASGDIPKPPAPYRVEMTRITGTDYSLIIRPNQFPTFTLKDIEDNVYGKALPEIGTICSRVTIRGMWSTSSGDFFWGVYGDADCPNGILDDWKK